MRGLLDGRIDLAFLRPDPTAAGLAFRPVAEEALFVLLPAAHRLAARRSLRLEEVADAPFINFPVAYAPALRRVIDDYLDRSGLRVVTAHEAETLPMVISLVLSTGGFSLLPAYAQRLLPPSVVGRRLHGPAPTITLAVGWRRSDGSAVLQRILADGEGFGASPPAASPQAGFF